MNEEAILGRILIIDDEKDNTEIIKDILEDVNYSTVLARSAAEAKTIVNTNSFDLILMDVLDAWSRWYFTSLRNGIQKVF